MWVYCNGCLRFYLISSIVCKSWNPCRKLSTTRTSENYSPYAQRVAQSHGTWRMCFRARTAICDWTRRKKKESQNLNPGLSAWVKIIQYKLWCGIIYNYSLKGRGIVVDIYRDAKRRGIYPPLFTDSEGDSCFSIYQIRWIKKRFFNVFFWNLRETTRHFSLRSQNSE